MAYCEWFMNLFGKDDELLDITWYSDEAWFHLTGCVNSQNTRIWATEHPTRFMKFRSIRKNRCVVCNLQLSHNQSNFLPRDFHYCLLPGDLQRISGSTWWWQTPKRIFSEGWSNMPHFEWEHGENRKLFWWPDYFENFMASKISWLKSAWFYPVFRH